jgi:choline dehydrogenase
MVGRSHTLKAITRGWAGSSSPDSGTTASPVAFDLTKARVLLQETRRIWPNGSKNSVRLISHRALIMDYHYIVIGAGTAGCVLANRLSSDPNTSVLLLEAGGKDNYFWIDIPVGYLYTIGNPRTDWCYQTEPDPGLNGRSIGYARGKVLGGCSSINAMVYMRGQRSDYDYWEGLGNRSWAWNDVLPVFKQSENYQHGADEFHGGDGELRVEERRVNWEILEAWRDAAEQCGIPKNRRIQSGRQLW